MKDDKIYIEHILRSIEKINTYLAYKNYQSFSDDFLTQDAVYFQTVILLGLKLQREKFAWFDGRMIMVTQRKKFLKKRN